MGACGGDDGDDTSSAGSGTTSAGAGGTQSQAQGSTQTPDPCGLVTVQEVSTALGAPIGSPEPSAFGPPLGGKSCIWSNTNAPPIRTFQITVRTNADIDKRLKDQGQTVERLFDDTKNLTKQDGKIAVEDVTGLGDRAFKTPSIYYVMKKGVSLQADLGLNSDPSAQARTALQTLTEKAVARI